MLPAVLAVLFLSPFVASEIYVGQYPQNVDAVVKDPYGNLVPVTGVADTIEVVDLNYGGNMTNNVTGMAIDISVTPVNASGVSSLEYPSYSGGEYPSYPSAGGISYPTAFYQPPSTMASGASGMGKPPASGFTNSFFPSGGFPSLFGPSMSPSGQPMSPSGPPMSPPTATNTPSAPFAPFPPFSGFGGSASPPTAEPFSPTNQAILSSLGSIPSEQSSSSGDNGSSKPKPSTPNKPNKPFSLFNPFGGSNPFGGGGKKKKPFSSFVALDGALGPVVTSNPTPTVPTTNINSAVESSTQDVEDYEYPDSSNDDDGVLSFLQSPLDSLKNLFFPNSTVPTSSEQSENIPDNDEEVEDPLSLLSNFAPSMTGDTGTAVPLNFTGYTPNGSATGLNSFLSGILNSTFPQWNNISSWNFTTPFFNSSQTPMNFANFLPNSNGMSSSLMNAFNSLMNSNSPSGQNTLKSSMSSLFPPSLFSSSEYDYYEYPEYDEFYPSGDEVEEPEYYSAPGQTVSTLMKSMPSMFSSFQNMFQKPSVMQSSPFSFLPLGNPASPLNSLSSMINSFLNPSSSSSQSPLSAFFPSSSSNQPPLPASSPSSANMGFLSSLFPTTAGGNNLLTDLESMVDNMLTPFANGTTPLTNMLTNMMKSLNGTSGSNPSMFANFLTQSMFTPSDTQMPFNLSSPLSPMSSILSAVNKTGMFGNMSDVLSLFNNLSYLTNQEENNPNFNDTLFWNQTVTDLQTMMKDMTSKLETFANSLNNTKFQKFVKNFNFTMLSSALDDLSAVNFTNLAQSSPSPSATFPARPSFPPRKPLPFSFNKPSSPSLSVPSIQPPLVNVGAGSSFLAIPTATDGMLGDAPATDSSQSTPSVPPPAQSSSTTNVNDPGIVDYASPSSPTTTSNPPVSTGNNTTPTSASGVNFGSTWIILLGVLATILGQKKFM